MKRSRQKAKFVVGIDEVGRGPIAGPVTVGVCIARSSRVLKGFATVKDSKQLSAEGRERWKVLIDAAREKGDLVYSVVSVSSKVIDTKGIVFAIKKAMAEALAEAIGEMAAEPGDCRVLLDGGLRAPEHFLDQTTIIRGDEKEPIIALASIVAKVARDAYMTAQTKKYPAYDFHIHKGYGTKAHYHALNKAGISPLHRKTFLKNLISRKTK